MYPGAHAQTTPDKPAVIMAGSGEIVTYAELDARSNQLAHYWRSIGLDTGDHVALLAENHPDVPRGLLGRDPLGPVPHRGQPVPVARGVRVHHQRQRLALARDHDGDGRHRRGAGRADIAGCTDRLVLDGTIDGFTSYDDAVSSMPTTKLDEEPLGAIMLYSSGTTGQPKGIKRPLTGKAVDDPSNAGISHARTVPAGHGRDQRLPVAGAALSRGAAGVVGGRPRARRAPSW